MLSLQIVKLLTAAIFLQFSSIFCGLVHYAAYVSNGFGVPVLAAANESQSAFVDLECPDTDAVLNISARLCFVLLLILIAKGRLRVRGQSS